MYQLEIGHPWNTLVFVPQPNDELPIPNERIHNLYLDFETTSENTKIASINPHSNCKLLGTCVLFDNEKFPYYIPLRHAYLDDEENYCYRSNNFPNFPLDKAYEWLRKILSITNRWVNHNIKYDIHVLINEIGFVPTCKFVDTLVLSKLAAFEERFSYSLDEMMKLIGIDITEHEKDIKKFLGKKYKDYGLIPPDRMAIYGAVDVLSERVLLEELLKRIPVECKRVVDLELELTSLLVGIEQIGIRTNPDEIVKDWKWILPRQTKRISRIAKATGLKVFDPSKKKDLKEVFIERLGWDIDLTEGTREKIEQFGWIPDDEIRYSYGYSSLYSHIRENPRIVSSYLKYVEEDKIYNSFIAPYLEEHIDGSNLIHPSFNQIVRTGRMSAGKPNIQQLPPWAKYYIVPYDETYTLVNFDLSQIEFRVIAHYIGNKKCIEDYNRNPKTDFHTWVAEMCGIPRKPAKNVNFMLGYGGGKNKCISMLSSLPEIVGKLQTKREIEEKALAVYNNYHNTLPELKRTQRRASDVLCSRGYVRTILNRHRHLPIAFNYKAFNSICQGSAADMMKDITLRLRKFLNSDCILHALVHDAWLFSIRTSRLKEIVPLIHSEIQKPIEGIDFSIPIVADAESSPISWGHCKKVEEALLAA